MKDYHFPLIEKTLETMLESDKLTIILKELNELVGSSDATCIERGCTYKTIEV